MIGIRGPLAIGSAAALLVAFLVLGCTVPIPMPTTTTAAPSPTRSATPSPSPTPGPSQDTILAAVARWLVEDGRADSVRYVHAEVSDARFGDIYFGADSHVPELKRAGPGLFGGEMTDATEAAISSALGEGRSLMFVDDPADVVDPDGFEHLGCRPYLDGGWLVGLGPPHLGTEGDRFFVSAYVDRGCRGDIYVIEVMRAGGAYEVSRLVASGHWTV